MTKREFLAALRKTPRRWKLDAVGAIKCNGDRCPIEAVYRLDHRRDSAGAWSAAEALRLSDALRFSIVSAADWPERRTPLRAELLRACGLR